MEWIIKQGSGCFCANGTWGADSPRIFLDKQEAETLLLKAQRNGNGRGAQVIENEQPYGAWQLSSFIEASRAVKDYGCEITQEGMLWCASINGGPELQFVFDDPQVWRLDVCTGEQRVLSRTEILYQFEQNTPIARWLRPLYHYDPLRRL